MKRTKFLQLFIGATLLTACQPLTNAMGFDPSFRFAESEADQVTYRFTDSSVPPRYHRSYSIVVTAQSISMTVDSYGDIVAQQYLPSSTAQLKTLLALLDEAQIRKGKPREERGCTGGTGDRISAHRNGQLLFEAYRYNCNGESGPLQGDVAAVKQQLKNWIPDFAKLMKT